MDHRLRSRVEIETIHELLPELDHYQLLGLTPDAAQADVDVAFRGASRRLHPDRHAAGATAEFRAQANEVFRAVSEAYRILRDPDTRAAYDTQRRAGLSAESKAVTEAAEAARDPAKAARTPKGERYWKLALHAWNEQNYQSCLMNIDFALTFEPANETFKEWKATAKVLADEQKKGKEGNTYKIRI